MFSGWQAYEAHRARLDARQSQTDARKNSERVQELQRDFAESAARDAKRSADAWEKSAAALLSTTRTFEATATPA